MQRDARTADATGRLRKSRRVLRWMHAREAALARAGRDRLEDVLGGPARTYVIVLFACLLGLEAADLSAVGAAASQLRDSLHLSNTEFGLLATLPLLSAAVASVPVGVLTDRVRRIPMLTIGVVIWAAAMIASAASGSFGDLLLFRVALGGATAVAGPTLASLTGDFFMPSERSRVYGFILTGELIGNGFGLLVSGELASVFGWRAAFWSLAPFALVLAWFLVRLPEPARGGTSRLQPGAEEIPRRGRAARSGRRHGEQGVGGQDEAEVGPGHDPAMIRAVMGEEVAPDPDLVLGQDPSELSLRQAVRYVLAVRTNVALIVASALGYFFTAGIATFGVLYMEEHYGVAKAVAPLMLMVVSLGALVGTIGGGRLCDALIARGRSTARMVIGGLGFILAGALLIPGVLVSSFMIALPLLIFAGMALAAPNPAIDAARLDVIHSRMWGRAEGVRTVLRTMGMAIAPLLFGAVSDLIGGGLKLVAPKSGYPYNAVGLQYTFVIMVIPMIAAGVVLLRARSRYPVEVASALEWERRTGEGGAAEEPGSGSRERRGGSREWGEGSTSAGARSTSDRDRGP